MPIIPINIKVTDDADYYITAEMDAQVYSRILPDGIIDGVGHNCDMAATQEKIIIQSGLICTQGYLMTVKDTVEIPYLPTDGKVYVKARLELGSQTDEWSIRLYNVASETKEDLFQGGRTREVLLATVQGTTITKHHLIKPLVDDMDKIRELVEKVSAVEMSRVKSEEKRVAQEDIRLSQESTRQSNEDIRQKQENKRNQDESSRKQQEQDRQTDEQQRKQSEDTRISQEQNRLTSEKQRQQAENIRNQSEINRTNSEKKREQAEQMRKEWFEQSKKAFDNSELGQVANRIAAVEKTTATTVETLKEEVGRTIQTAKTDMDAQLSPVLTKITALEKEERVNDVSVENHVLRIKKGSKVSEVALPKNDNIIAYQLANQLVNPGQKASFTLAMKTRKGLGAALIVLKGDNPDEPSEENKPLLQVETFEDLNRLSGNLLSWITPVSGYQSWQSMLVSNFEILDLYLKNVTAVPNDVKQYLNAQMNQNSSLYQFIAEHPNVSKLMTGTAIDFGTINRLKEYVTVVESDSTLKQLVGNQNNVNYIVTNDKAMQAVAASDKAMQAVAASDKAMQAVAASDKAMQAVIASDKAMQAVVASDKAMQAVAASDKAKNALMNHNDVLQKNAKTIYNTISTSNKWHNVGFRNSDYALTFSQEPKSIVFTNVGGYSTGTAKVVHSNNIIAGQDSIPYLSGIKTLDLNKLIITFAQGQGQLVSGDDYYIYEVWTPKE